MDISSFDDLLQAACMQPEPQRLLFVFAAVELPDDATPAQRARFDAGQGGALVPLMCVDKTPQELASFDALVTEARQFTAPGPRLGHRVCGGDVRHAEPSAQQRRCRGALAAHGGCDQGWGAWGVHSV